MKKLVFLLTSFLLLVTLAGCDKDSKNSIDMSESLDTVGVTAINDELPVLAEYLVGYKTFLTDMAEKDISEYSFALAYIDEDEIPELVIKKESDSFPLLSIYSYENSSVEKRGDVSSMGLRYTPYKNDFAIYLWDIEDSANDNDTYDYLRRYIELWCCIFVDNPDNPDNDIGSYKNYMGNIIKAYSADSNDQDYYGITPNNYDSSHMITKKEFYTEIGKDTDYSTELVFHELKSSEIEKLFTEDLTVNMPAESMVDTFLKYDIDYPQYSPEVEYDSDGNVIPYECSGTIEYDMSLLSKKYASDEYKESYAEYLRNLITNKTVNNCLFTIIDLHHSGNPCMVIYEPASDLIEDCYMFYTSNFSEYYKEYFGEDQIQKEQAVSEFHDLYGGSSLSYDEKSKMMYSCKVSEDNKTISVTMYGYSMDIIDTFLLAIPDTKVTYTYQSSGSYMINDSSVTAENFYESLFDEVSETSPVPFYEISEESIKMFLNNDEIPPTLVSDYILNIFAEYDSNSGKYIDADNSVDK